MRTRTLYALVAGALTLMVAWPATAAPPSTDTPGRDYGPRLAPEADIPHDGRPIVATVIEIDQQSRTVTLDTPHGAVALAVTQDVVDSLSVGDIVVVRFTDDDAESDDYPSASPPLGAPQRI